MRVSCARVFPSTSPIFADAVILAGRCAINLYDTAHFAAWARTQQLTTQAIHEAAVASFMERHLLERRCSSSVHRSQHEIRAALRYLLEALRASGVLEPRCEDADPVAVEISRFLHYMQNTSLW